MDMCQISNQFSVQAALFDTLIIGRAFNNIVNVTQTVMRSILLPALIQRDIAYICRLNKKPGQLQMYDN